MVARKKKRNTICSDTEGSRGDDRHIYQNSHYHHNQQQQQHLNLSAEQIYQRVGRRRSNQLLPLLPVSGSGSRHLYAQVRQQQQRGGLRRQEALLLCCVCEDKNSTYRYEVVYRSPAKADGGGDKGLTLLPVYATVAKKNKKANVNDDNREDDGADSEDHAYYNFPPRHPRHGHLQWPVLRPDSAAAIRDGACLRVFFHGQKAKQGCPEGMRVFGSNACRQT